MLARVLLHTTFLALTFTGALRAEPVAPNRSEPADCNYSKFPLHRSGKLRGVLSLHRYGGGRSANAPKWTTAYVIMLESTMCEFEVLLPRSATIGSDLGQGTFSGEKGKKGVSPYY
jgi:hypothetical protein